MKRPSVTSIWPLGGELGVRTVHLPEHVREGVPGVAEEAFVEAGGHGAMVVDGGLPRDASAALGLTVRHHSPSPGSLRPRLDSRLRGNDEIPYLTSSEMAAATMTISTM